MPPNDFEKISSKASGGLGSNPLFSWALPVPIVLIFSSPSNPLPSYAANLIIQSCFIYITIQNIVTSCLLVIPNLDFDTNLKDFMYSSLKLLSG